MNKLRITLKEDGSIVPFSPDFKIMRGCYGNVLINIEVPRNLLIDTVLDDNNINIAGNSIRVGAIIKTATGDNLTTKKYELQYVKDFVREGIEYRLYQRKMPKPFTMWETVSTVEATQSGHLNMVINVINWTLNNNQARVEEVAANPVCTLQVYQSDFLDQDEQAIEVSDFDILYGQTQELEADYREFEGSYRTWIQGWYNNTKAEFDALETSLRNEIQTSNANLTQSFTNMQTALETDFATRFANLNARMGTVERDSLIRIDGQAISDADLITLVQNLPDGLYIANTSQYGDEILLISTDPDDNKNIARYNAMGASYYLNFDIMDWELSAGGGGGGSSSSIRLSATSSLQMTVAAGSSALLTYYFKSSMAGKGTAKFYVNNALKATQSIDQGNNSYDIGQFITAGSNSVIVNVTDTAGTSASIEYLIEGVALTLASPFEDAQAYTGAIEFRYTVSGETTKTVHFKVDDGEPTTVEINSTRQQTFSIPAQTHGVHTFEVWATATVNSINLESNHLKYNLITYVSENDTVIISSKFDQEETTEGETVAIDYFVYDPTDTTTEVTLAIDGTTSQTVSVGRTKQYWYLRDLSEGDRTLTISAGGQTLTIELTVNASDFNLSAVSEGLELFLNAYGRSNNETNKDVWSYESISATFSNMNWSTNGWINNALRLNGAAQCVIPFKIFEDDIRTYGKTIEFEFAARNVSTIDTIAIVSYNNSKGIKLKMNEALIQSEQSSVSTKYKDDERIRVSFVIDDKNGLRLIRTFVNGVLSGLKQYPANDDFQQSTPVNITINPDGGTVDIYKIRVYNYALSDNDMLNNYMADLDSLSDRIAEYNKNNIFDANGEISFEKVRNKVATVIITGTLPTVKGDKKSAQISYENPNNVSRNFSQACQVDVQGTSSQYYPRKNFKVKFSSALDFFGNGLGEKSYTIKVNYMESGNRNNTGIANFLQGADDTIYSEQLPPQEDNALIRSCIKGEPVLLFHKATEASIPTFYALADFNYDKLSENAMGFAGNELAESWEFKDNDEPLCLFNTNNFSRNANAFEARYPDGNTDFTNIDALVDWVYTNRNDLATFKAEFEDHFNLHYTLMYYILTEAFGMIDSRAKNMFLNTYDGEIWYPVFYDMDTAFGLNNEGVNTFEYNIEYNDQIGSQNVFNGSSSVLWNNFKTAYADEIKALYQSLRASGKLTASTLISALNEATSAFSKGMYNADAKAKYIAPLEDDNDGTYLYCAQGDRLEHLKWWIDKRFKYLDSKYHAADYANDYISMRIYSPGTNASTNVVPFSGTFSLKSFISMYLGVRYGANGDLYKTRASAETSTSISATQGTDLNDKETYIYGASQIKDLGSLANKYVGTLDVSKAVHLSSLVVGNSNSNYSNTNLTDLQIGNNDMLESIDIRNCPNLATNLNLAGCKNIKTIYATGTSITSVTLPDGGNLETMTLPATITNLTLKNQPLITTISMAGYTNVATLVVENCSSAVNTLVMNILNNSTALSRVRLTNVSWSLTDKTIFDKILQCGGIDENNNNTASAIVTGTCYISSIGQNDLDAIRAAFPNLTVTYGTLIEQFTITFENYDGTVLEVQYVDKGSSGVDPVTRASNPIATPTRAADAQYTYTYTGWSGVLTNVYANRTVVAQYSTTINSYTVNFYNGSSGTDVLLYTVTVNYGSAASYVGNTPSYAGNESGTFLFNGWSPSVSNITGNTNAYATFAKLEVPATVKPLSQCSPAEIKAIANAGTKNASQQWVIGSDVWFEIGDETTIELTNGETLTLVLADFNHDVDSSNNALPFTFITKELLATSKQMNSSSTNAGGWANSAMYSYIQGTVWGWIPDSWKMIITPAVKKSTEGSQSTNILSSTDNLFLLSYSEVKSGLSAPYTDEGTTYPIFTNNSSRVKKKVGGTNGIEWWLRSPYANYSTYFWYVSSSGGTYNIIADFSYGVCFAFCV